MKSWVKFFHLGKAKVTVVACGVRVFLEHRPVIMKYMTCIACERTYR